MSKFRWLLIAPLLLAALAVISAVISVTVVYAAVSEPGYVVLGVEEIAPSEPVDLAVWGLMLERSGECDLGNLAALYGQMAAAAQRHGLRLSWVATVIDAESKFDPRAKSPCGALGLMQIMPSNFSWLGITDPFDVEQNLEGGCKYLAGLMKRYRGNETLALLGYNAGPSYARLAWEHWPAESRGYIRRVRAGERMLIASVNSNSSGPSAPLRRVLAGDAGRQSGGQGNFSSALLLRAVSGRETASAVRRAGREDGPDRLGWPGAVRLAEVQERRQSAGRKLRGISE